MCPRSQSELSAWSHGMWGGGLLCFIIKEYWCNIKIKSVFLWSQPWVVCMIQVLLQCIHLYVSAPGPPHATEFGTVQKKKAGGSDLRSGWYCLECRQRLFVVMFFFFSFFVSKYFFPQLSLWRRQRCLHPKQISCAFVLWYLFAEAKRVSKHFLISGSVGFLKVRHLIFAVGYANVCVIPKYAHSLCWDSHNTFNILINILFAATSSRFQIICTVIWLLRDIITKNIFLIGCVLNQISGFKSLSYLIFKWDTCYQNQYSHVFASKQFLCAFVLRKFLIVKCKFSTFFLCSRRVVASSPKISYHIFSLCDFSYQN